MTKNMYVLVIIFQSSVVVFHHCHYSKKTMPPEIIHLFFGMGQIIMCFCGITTLVLYLIDAFDLFSLFLYADSVPFYD